MDTKLLLVFLVLGLALVAESSFSNGHWGLNHYNAGRGDGELTTPQTCNGLVGECINETEEMFMDSESIRRSLVPAKRFISYGALKKNQVPCGSRGQSYYNCQRTGKANPYSRGCNVITHCARILN